MTDRAETVVCRFRPREAFPPDDPLSVAILRLMAAVNDVRSIQKSTLIAMESLSGPNDIEQLLLEGELGYFTRMLFGHLHEAGIAFRDLDDGHRAEVDALIAGNEEVRWEIEMLRRAFRDTSEGSLNEYLKAVRTPWAFHYKCERFKEALKEHPEEATLVVSEFAGVGRFTITDDFARAYMLEKAGGTVGEYERLYGEAIGLAGTLGRAVDQLLGELVVGRGAEVGETQGTVRVPEEVLRARDRQVKRGSS